VLAVSSRRILPGAPVVKFEPPKKLGRKRRPAPASAEPEEETPQRPKRPDYATDAPSVGADRCLVLDFTGERVARTPAVRASAWRDAPPPELHLDCNGQRKEPEP